MNVADYFEPVASLVSQVAFTGGVPVRESCFKANIDLASFGTSVVSFERHLTDGGAVYRITYSAT